MSSDEKNNWYGFVLFQSVLQSLCDQEITLVAQDTTMSLPEQVHAGDHFCLL